MKLYYHPASTTSRTVMLFAAESGIPLEMKVVDLFTGEHTQPPFQAVNPNRLVPVLEDGDFRLTESSAILKYLADMTGSPLYPKDLQARARVNERMDWVNTQLCRDFAYGFVYPQIFSFHKRRSDEAHDATLQWGKERAQGWLRVLNDDILGSGKLTGSDFSKYPNVQRWLARMKSLRQWGPVFEAINGYGATLKDQPMLTV
jgi:glutathione S-transferase